MATAPQVSAQEAGIMNSGDLAVTGFSGVLPPADGSGSIDKTFINLDGASLKLFEVGEPAHDAQVLDAPPKFEVYARDIGQVFGVALDNALAPNIYVTATSAHGLQIVIPDSDGDGLPERVKTGQPGAEFMDGQFGTALGGGPGSVWKIDGVTGEVSLFADIISDGQPSSGPGLGNIAFDPSHYQLYVSDLDTGLIHRLDMNGSDLGSFDHGTQARPVAGLGAVAEDPANRMDITSPAFNSEDASTWGLADSSRRVWGLAYYKGRLYYGVDEGPQIWSIDIADDGSFGSDARLEIELVPGGFPVSDILFTPRGRMVLAQRGGIQGSYDYTQHHIAKTNHVLRYRQDKDGNWLPEPDEYAIGFPDDHRNASGGVALSCSNTLWSTGDALRDNPALADRLAAGGEAVVHGVQGNSLSLVRPRNVPPWSSVFVDYDGQYGDPENTGHVGDVEVFRRCEGGRTETWPGWTPGWLPPEGWVPPPWWPRTPDLEIEKQDTQCTPDPAVQGSYLCTFTITVTNVGAANYTGHLNVVDNVPAHVEYVPPPGGSIPWHCQQPGGPGGAIDCTSQNVETLLSGQSENLELTVRRMPAYEGDVLHNCAVIDRPGDPDWNNEDCGDAFPPGPDLEMQKTLNQCYPTPGGTICTFWLDVINSGSGIYNGPLHIVEDVPPGSLYQGMVNASHPAWNCASINPGQVSCTLPGPVTMFPGDGHWVEVSIFIPAHAGGELENCVHLGDPEHAGDPDINGNNRACVPFRTPQPVQHECPAGWQEVPPAGPNPGWQVIAVDGINPDGSKWGLMCMKAPAVPIGGKAYLCPQGWTKVSKDASTKPGWQRIKVGSGNNAVYCRKRLPVVFKCPTGWRQFANWSQVPKGWQRRRIGSGNNAIYCAKPLPVVYHCPAGWKQFASWSQIPKGWLRKRIGSGSNAVYCGRRLPVAYHCPAGWKQFASWSQIPKGWLRKRIGSGSNTVYCGKPERHGGQTPPLRPLCRGGKLVMLKTLPPRWVCHCPRGKHLVGGTCVPNLIECRKGSHRVGKRCVPNATVQCARGMRKVRGKCLPIVRQPQCDRGFRRVGKRCVPIVTRRPKVKVRPEIKRPVQKVRPKIKRPSNKIRPKVLRPSLKLMRPVCRPGTRPVNGKCLPVVR